jgi:hypothetical protein
VGSQDIAIAAPRTNQTSTDGTTRSAQQINHAAISRRRDGGGGGGSK